MKARIWLLVCLSISLLQPEVVLASSASDTLLTELNRTLQSKPSLIEKKQARIENLTRVFQKDQASLLQQFQLCNQLYNEYKTFKYDSAFVYALKLQKISSRMEDANRIAYSNLKLSFSLLSSGMYKEAIDSLSTVQVANLPDSLKAEYYVLMSRTYYELAAYNADSYYIHVYNTKGNLYSDSAIAITSKETLQYYFLRGILRLKERNYEQARKDFQLILDKFNPSHEEYGMTASALASVYLEIGQRGKATDLMIKAAIADIKASTKEGLALAYVADLLYQEGEEVKAYSYIKEALADATFYGAKLRLKHVFGILPVIEGDRLSTVEAQKQRLITFAVVVSVLSVLVVAFAFIIFKQLKQLRLAKKTVTEANENLLEANSQLNQANEVLQAKNDELLEAHRIKEEYIGYSFNMYAAYLDKLEKIKKAIEKKLATKSVDGISQVLESINMKKEREAVYLSFDKIFTKLFPNFVSAFNSFFREEDQYVLREDQPLTIDLRIFALMRIGISDPDQIARILEYSVRTIYNNKSKVKNKSLLSNEEFESRVMEIKAF